MSGISFVVQKPHPCLLWHDVFSTLLGDFLAKSFHLTFILLPLFLPPPVPQKEVDLLIPDFKSVHSLEIFLGLWFKCPPSRYLFQKRWPKGKRNTQIEQKWPKWTWVFSKRGQRNDQEWPLEHPTVRVIAVKQHLCTHRKKVMLIPSPCYGKHQKAKWQYFPLEQSTKVALPFEVDMLRHCWRQFAQLCSALVKWQCRCV